MIPTYVRYILVKCERKKKLPSHFGIWMTGGQFVQQEGSRFSKSTYVLPIIAKFYGLKFKLRIFMQQF